MEFNTISVNDGITMGTEGMKGSLVSREVIADSIELTARGHMLRRPGVPRRLRQEHARRGDGARPARHPGRHPLQRHDPARASYRGRDVTVQSVFEAVGAYRAGKISARGLWELENVACPGAGACGGQFTANTMSTALEFLGLSPAGLNGIPARLPGEAGGGAEDAASWP